jgi:hypothetical protein
MTRDCVVKCAAPYNIAACAPKLYQRTPSETNALVSATYTSTSADRTRHKIELLLQSDVMLEILLPSFRRGTARVQPRPALRHALRCLAAGVCASGLIAGRYERELLVRDQIPATSGERAKLLASRRPFWIRDLLPLVGCCHAVTKLTRSRA